MKVLELKELCRSYKGKKRSSVQALQNLSLDVLQGEVFGFLGPNGAGKSTTIKLIMGLLAPTSGSVTICGLPASNPMARRNVGYLPENPAFYDFMTAGEYLRFVGKSFGMRERDIADRCSYVLDLLELKAASTRAIRGYSKGMVQRLGLAQALIGDPDIYVLDEPMSGLDPVGRSLVKNIIRDLKVRGKTVFFSTHITADVEAVCDRVGIIANGRLQALDTVGNILREGVEGYVITVRDSHGHIREIVMPKDGIRATLDEIVASGCSIENIEQKRKDMEAFFLNIIGSHSHEDTHHV